MGQNSSNPSNKAYEYINSVADGVLKLYDPDFYVDGQGIVRHKRVPMAGWLTEVKQDDSIVKDATIIKLKITLDYVDDALRDVIRQLKKNFISNLVEETPMKLTSFDGTPQAPPLSLSSWYWDVEYCLIRSNLSKFSGSVVDVLKKMFEENGEVVKSSVKKSVFNRVAKRVG